ncbi:HAD family hydrolase [Deinococcus radiotolerans]|uniref:HAD-superfamily hydrolase, subfamily IIB n=1 Tax=Deinococcus radiotolerans TaxID=1309407 RepID=A0ABQ2FML6_9DEIO|nr:HAD hydrolase family protein [Deinococcus radiotolerans]GGL04851.1 hypothetical protein GCM10010844_24520 [Deinococcus radiotolerans]
MTPTALLALDFDGTLVGPQGDVPAGLLDELHAWARGGAHLALLTARGRVPPEVRDWPLHTVSRCYGAWAQVGGQLAWSRPLADDTVRAALEALTPGAWRWGRTLMVTADPIGIVRGPHAAFAAQWPQAREVLKLVRGDTPARLDALKGRWATLPGTHVIRERDTRLVLVRQGACKGAALRALAGRLGVPGAQVVAAGDGPADAAMLAHAGTFIRVGAHAALAGATLHATCPADVPGVLAHVRARLLGCPA